MHKQIRLRKDNSRLPTDVLDFGGFAHIASNTEEGYFLLPRAAGNDDYGLCIFTQHKEDFDVTLRDLNMPVFGIKTKDRCTLVVVSGMIWNFTLRVVLKDGIFSLYPAFELAGEMPYEDFVLDLFELSGEDANYSGMARTYRKFRQRKGELTPLSVRAENNPYLAYAIDAPLIRIRCGWKPAPPEVLHQTRETEPEMHVACDFDRVGDILDELKAQGVDKAEICLVGWNVKGHDGRWPEAFPVCRELGGEEKLRALIQKAHTMGYQITCHTNSTDQYEIAANYDKDNTRRLRDGTLPTGGYWSGGEMYELCPKIGYAQALETLPKVASLGFRGLHYIDVLGVIPLRRCFHETHPVTYPESLSCSKKLCALACDLFGGISSEGAYDHIAPYLDYGLYISFSQGGSILCDEPVPFWQLVYHGTVLSNPYPTTVNCTFKTADALLKLLEYGGKPTFYFYSAFMGNGANWMGNTDCTCLTDDDLRRSVQNIKKAYDIYRTLSDTRYADMHSHEKRSDGVYETTYSDGTVVQVDYHNKTWEIRKAEV